jgi:uncharacterized protein
MTLEVTENAVAHRFEIAVDGALAGFTQYRPVDVHTWDFFHTEIDPALEGRGLASQLIGRTLDQLRARRIALVPSCPFVRGYLDKHSEYVAMVPVSQRPRFGLADPDFAS